MAIYLIYACEEMYNGLHGMNSVAITESNNLKSVQWEAKEMSRYVMDSYSDIAETLLDNAREQAESLGIYDESDPEFENILEQEYDDNICYYIYELSDEYTEDQYNDMLEELDAEEIAKKYGKLV